MFLFEQINWKLFCVSWKCKAENVIQSEKYCYRNSKELESIFNNGVNQLFL